MMAWLGRSLALALSVAIGVSGAVAAQSPSVPPAPTPIPGTVAAPGALVVHGTYGLGFGRAPALVPRGAAVSGATSAGPWLVTSVVVAPGDRVEAGAELATADTTILQLQAGAAQAAADLADAKLAKTLAKPTAQERSKADALLAVAQQRLDGAEQTLLDTRAQGKAAIAGARDAVAGAQARLKRDRRTDQLPATIAADRAAIAAARAALDNVRATATVNESRAKQAVDAAKLSLDAARADHAVAIAPSAPDLVAADRAALATAQLNLARAQDALTGARIVAPVSGVVSMVALAVGTSAPAGDGIQVQEGPMEVLAQVPEADIMRVRAGAPATVSIPAMGGVTLVGTVAWVAPAPGSAPGAPTVTYPVSVILSEPGDDLRAGMTVSVAIDTADT